MGTLFPSYNNITVVVLPSRLAYAKEGFLEFTNACVSWSWVYFRGMFRIIPFTICSGAETYALVSCLFPLIVKTLIIAIFVAVVSSGVLITRMFCVGLGQIVIISSSPTTASLRIASSRLIPHVFLIFSPSFGRTIILISSRGSLGILLARRTLFTMLRPPRHIGLRERLSSFPAISLAFMRCLLLWVTSIQPSATPSASSPVETRFAPSGPLSGVSLVPSSSVSISVIIRSIPESNEGCARPNRC